MSGSFVLRLVVVLALLPAQLRGEDARPQSAESVTSVYQQWKYGPSHDPAYFPIAVWLQAPRNAQKFQAAGINLYVGLWQGPTEEQLSQLKAAGMPVICDQNRVGLTSDNADVIVGWMHGDEPDNAQPRRDGEGYGPPISPETIVADFQQLKSRDSTRPILLNLGQGVAFDQYIGRGVRRNHPEDYAQYIKGCDIVSFDIYPAVHDHPTVAGKLEFVAQGVERLRRWSNDEKIVWNCIECSRIGNREVKPTPQQIRSEVWMSLIHGSRGLIYFVHQFEPRFVEASVLEDRELLAAITDINRQVRELAPVLNSTTQPDAAEVKGSDSQVPVATLCKEYDGALYLFAVAMRGQATSIAVTLPSERAVSEVEVLGESRKLSIVDGRFQDDFEPYAVHLYRIR